MNYIIQNEMLTAVLSDGGAELISLKDQSGTEMIWQGDESIWNEHSPVLFPICGRLDGGIYAFEGKTYEMGLHGFARFSRFACVLHKEDEIMFLLQDNEETRKQYPFSFALSVIYRLRENALIQSFRVENLGKGVMPFSIGAHPGFRVPIDDDAQFEDYSIEFPPETKPQKLLLTPEGLNTTQTEAYPLAQNVRISLSHRMFDLEDSLFLTHVPGKVSLVGPNRRIEIAFRGFVHLGFWQTPGVGAPYLCIEPWMGSPSIKGGDIDLERKPDLVWLERGENWEGEIVFLFD